MNIQIVKGEGFDAKKQKIDNAVKADISEAVAMPEADRETIIKPTLGAYLDKKVKYDNRTSC
jgi:hypothetical protein